MKKLLVLLLMNFCLSINTSFTDFSTTEEITIGMGENSTNVKIDDLDYIKNSSYIYYYGDGCPHCADLDEYLQKTGLYDILNLVKKEIWYDEENAKEMTETIIRLGLDATKIGVPFVVIKNGENENYMAGSDTVIEYFTPLVGEAPKSNNKIIVLIIFTVLAIIISVGLIKVNR